MTQPPDTPSPAPGVLTPWSAELEQLHEESSRHHFLDVWTRDAIISRTAMAQPGGTIVEVGCSSGYLLEDLAARFPAARLVGVDLVHLGLIGCLGRLPDTLLLQADATRLPLRAASADALVSANLLEHVPDDLEALRQMLRVLKPGAGAAIVVPAGANLYDYYDRFLGHQRRYRRGELATKARLAGFEVLEEFALGSFIYPAFWLVKKRNRMLRDGLSGQDLRRQVQEDMNATKDSRLGHLTTRLEAALVAHSVRLPLGVRQLTLLRRPKSYQPR